MPVTIEEEVVLLYALHCCGGAVTKQRATTFILTKGLLQSRDGDEDTVSTHESRVENRIAWTRQNLKAKGHLAMPEHGTWKLTEAGQKRLFSLAWRLHDDRNDGLLVFEGVEWKRFSLAFLDRLRELGAYLSKKQAEGGFSL